MGSGSSVRPSAGGRALWFGLLGGAAAWTLHLLTIHFAVETVCSPGDPLGVTTTVILAIFSLLMLIAAVASAVTAAGVLRGARGRRSGERGALTHLAGVGLGLGLAFALLIALEALPFLVVGPCGAV